MKKQQLSFIHFVFLPADFNSASRPAQLAIAVMALVLRFKTLLMALLSLIALLTANLCVAVELMYIPLLSARVVDITATLRAEDQAQLESRLWAFEKRNKGSQIAVLIVPTTKPETIEHYSRRVAEQWKAGRENIDDGAILVVAKNDQAARIEVGDGLEGALNEIVSKRIISEIILPRFQQGDFFAGISQGVERMMRAMEGELLPQASAAAPTTFKQWLLFSIALTFILGGCLRAIIGRLGGAIVTASVVGLIVWFLVGTALTAVLAAMASFVLALMIGAGLEGWYGGRSGGGGSPEHGDALRGGSEQF